MDSDDDPHLTAVLQQALEALPERQRQVFLAVRHEAVSYAALARRLGISTEAVELAFVDALIALAEAADGRPEMMPQRQ